MPFPLSDLLLPAARARFVLLANHVLGASPAATQRLKPFAGRTLRFEFTGWRGPLPVPPALALRITPAGLLDADEGALEEGGADLRVRIDASQPLKAAGKALSGSLPDVAIEGDAALAGEVNWVLANVRWDFAADLERVFGPLVADGLSRSGERLADAARTLAQTVGEGASGLMQRAGQRGRAGTP